MPHCLPAVSGVQECVSHLPLMLKIINVGVIGLHFGHEIIKEHLIAGAAAPYFRLAGVCALTRAKVDAFAEQYGVKAYYDVASLLADPDIQAVCLMTRPFGRAQIIEQIIDAGKHVMTTKPFEVDGDAAIAALRHARERGIVVHLNSPTPQWSPDLAQIKAWESARRLIQALYARQPERMVFVINLLPNSGDFSPDAASLPAQRNPVYNQLVRQIIEEINTPLVHFIDGRELLADASGLTTDLLHPSDDGHVVIGENLALLTAPQLKKIPPHANP